LLLFPVVVIVAVVVKRIWSRNNTLI